MQNWMRALGAISSQMIHLNFMPSELFKQIAVQVMRSASTTNATTPAVGDLSKIQNGSSSIGSVNNQMRDVGISNSNTPGHRSAFKPYVHRGEEQQRQANQKTMMIANQNALGLEHDRNRQITDNRNEVSVDFFF
jgi:hypothetical protein